MFFPIHHSNLKHGLQTVDYEFSKIERFFSCEHPHLQKPLLVFKHLLWFGKFG